MQYLLFICTEPGRRPEPGRDMAAETDAWVDEMERRGIRLRGDQLRPPSDATTVRVRDGETLLTDGPFAETREQIAGFDLIDCASLDEAIEVAAKHPVASFGMVEVRPLMFDLPRLSPARDR
jgi:hypothetical protein